MKGFIAAAAALVALSAPAFSHDFDDDWLDEPGAYVERRVTVETFVRPAYRAPEHHVYVARPAEVFDDVPYVDYAPRPRSYAVVAPYDDRECIVKRRWHHGRLTERIRCD